MQDISTTPDLIRWALRWAWDSDVLTQQQAEQGMDWVDEHDMGRVADSGETELHVSDLPNEQANR